MPFLAAVAGQLRPRQRSTQPAPLEPEADHPAAVADQWFQPSTEPLDLVDGRTVQRDNHRRGSLEEKRPCP